MPITQSAKKALRSSKKKKVFNLRRSNEMRDLIKQYKKLIAENKREEANKIMPMVQKAIDKASKRGIIKKNNANRKKSRLAKKVAPKEVAKK